MHLDLFLIDLGYVRNNVCDRDFVESFNGKLLHAPSSESFSFPLGIDCVNLRLWGVNDTLLSFVSPGYWLKKIKITQNHK